jgi:hypothetical protein
MAMVHNRWRRLVPLLLLMGIALLVVWQNRRLGERRRAGLPGAPAYTADAPPFLNFLTVGLGGFRGVAAEVLWARADRLQEEGRYFELVQLAGWITWLDPHATEAWVYNAWNMAYNISVMMRRPADRVRWVDHGIALLRDDGLAANPRCARLYRELAWLYQHKIGSSDDTAYQAYQLALATTLAPLLQPDGRVADTPSNRVALAALRLDARRMRQVEEQFGPLDWRVASSHAVYWAVQGLPYARGQERLASRRAVYQPLLQAVRTGRLTGDLAPGDLRMAPNPQVIRPALQFMAETLRETPSPGVRMAYAFFLLQAIRQADTLGETAQVAAWLQELQRVSAGVLRPITLEAIRRGEMPEALR